MSNTKKLIAATVFSEMIKAGQTRKSIIFELAERADLTYNGASTYYTNFKSGKWSGVKTMKEESVNVVTKPDFEKMPTSELIAFYNSRVDRKIVKFRDRATAIRRVAELAV